jgi:hypothetical protein
MPRTHRPGLVAGLLAAVLIVLQASIVSGQAKPPRDEVNPVEPVGHSGSRGSTRIVTKLLVIVEENHSLGQMKQGMPFTFALAKKYGFATSYRGITHPSLPNYIAIASGTTHKVRDDKPPADHPLPGPSVFGQAIAEGRTAALYAQGMPEPCATTDTGSYVARHNPWAYFVDERASCRQSDVSMRRFSRDVARGTLPRVGMVIPDLDHDAHDGTLGVADAWFESLMTDVFAGRDWQTGRLAVVLTADEDDRAHGNRVLTVVIHRSQRHHLVSEPLTHYSLTRLYEDVAHLPFLNNAATANSMAEAFGLPVPRR